MNNINKAIALFKSIELFESLKKGAKDIKDQNNTILLYNNLINTANNMIAELGDGERIFVLQLVLLMCVMSICHINGEDIDNLNFESILNNGQMN